MNNKLLKFVLFFYISYLFYSCKKENEVIYHEEIDTTPPYAEFVFPSQDYQNLNYGETVTIKVAASDNKQVFKVEFWIDVNVYNETPEYARSSFVDYEAPWEWTVTVNFNYFEQYGVNAIHARVYDGAGNSTHIAIHVYVQR